MRYETNFHLLLLIFLVLIFTNLFILDLKIFYPLNDIKFSDVSTAATPIPAQNTATADAACPANCLDIIRQNLTVGGPELTPQTPSVTTQPKEYYIPLGTGATGSNSWEDIIATETVIDPANYGNIKEAYFIASLRNPTQNGQVEAELYNVTDKNMVWGSHLVMNGSSTLTLTSENIAFPNGPKLYRVQLKSSLSYQVYLDNAKIKILTN